MRKVLLLLLLILICSVVFAQTAEVSKNAIKNVDVSQSDLLKQTFGMNNSTVVAKVGNVIITKEQLMRTIWEQNANTVLEALINEKILEQAFAKEKIFVTKEDYDNEVALILAQYKVNTIDEFLAKSGVSNDDFIREVKIQFRLKKLVEKKININEIDFSKYMKPSHILIKFDSSIENEVEREEECKKKISEIFEKVKAGEDFAALAKQYSEDGSKVNGGTLGWVDANVNFVPEFKAAMIKLKAGEYSEPVKSQFGYHIIKMEARGDTVSETELNKLIENEKANRAKKIINTWFEEAKKEYNVVNYLIPVSSKIQTPSSTVESK